MKNRQFLPFERNRYYSGKTLTSADFVAEQLYINNKRRFLNSAMYGPGIICGLNVIGLDSMSVMVESGAAIDGAGREIVVESSTVKKLTALAGYSAIDGNEALLCLRYKEKEVHPVYHAPAGNTEAEALEYEYNRIDEGYELYLASGESMEAASFAWEEGFLNKKILVDDENYTLQVETPLIVPMENDVRIDFKVFWKQKAAGKLPFGVRLFLPECIDVNGAHEFVLRFSQELPGEGKILCKSCWIHVARTGMKEAHLLVRKEDAGIRGKESGLGTAEDAAIDLALTEESPNELAARLLGRKNLETRIKFWEEQQIVLARLSLRDTGRDYILRGIREFGIKSYIAIPGEEGDRSRYLAYFRNCGTCVFVPSPPSEENGEEKRTVCKEPEAAIKMASGKLEIPLKENMKKGSVCYSEEIVHGLGAGDVYVEVGLALRELASDEKCDTIYGDISLFHNEEFNQITTAVKVMKSRGSFQVAVRLNGRQKSVIVPLNWVAIKAQ